LIGRFQCASRFSMMQSGVNSNEIYGSDWMSSFFLPAWCNWTRMSCIRLSRATRLSFVFMTCCGSIALRSRAAREVWVRAKSELILGGSGHVERADSATAMASSTCFNYTNLSCARASAGMSSRSRSLRAGSITVVMPARSAASTFSGSVAISACW
jgi:hypothetical protein